MPSLPTVVVRPLGVACVFFSVLSDACAQGLEYIQAHYTKYEYRIPMRDGVKLFTAVYVPKDRSRTYPMLLTRTPYNVKPYGVDQYKTDLGPTPFFAKAGYIFVYQDVRGRWMSEGTFVNVRPHVPDKKTPKDIDESSDTYDTFDWLLKNVPAHNGKAGQWGISYPGFYTACGMIDAHPALKAASPQAPVTDWFVGDDFHRNGAFFLPHFFNFFAHNGKARPQPTKKTGPPFDYETPDGYQFYLDLGPLPNISEKYFKNDIAFWNEFKQHPNYDEYWQARNIRQHLKQIRPAVLTVGGWLDAENLFGALEVYKKIKQSSPGATNHLVMGPWLHGGWSRMPGDALGNVRFNAKTADYYREQLEFPFFEYHLKGKGQQNLPEALVFESGTNQWQRYDSWPPKHAQNRALYFLPGGKLALDTPPTEKADAFDEYTSDPAKPVPYIDKTAIGMDATFMVGDQRFASSRPDVLTYQTELLTEDLTLSGTLQANLHVSTTGTDADWIVKLIDVYPTDFPDPTPNPTGVKMGGFQQLVRAEVMRGRFRSSFEKPEAFVPGQPTVVKFAVQDVCHTFRPGHRIMVHVQSTWFPLVDRNPQTFVDIYQAKETDFRKANMRVYRTAEMASQLKVQVVK